MFQTLRGSGPLRRLIWRIGRLLYKGARGEQGADDIRTDGESFLQGRVIAAVPTAERLTVVDIGANHGEWTRALLDQLPQARRNAEACRIELFEPVPATADVLAQNLPAACTAFAHVNRVALSDRAGEAEMSVSKTAGSNSLHTGAPSAETVRVPLLTLSDFCRQAGIARIHLAKCDTEGHDLAVLRGAGSLLAEGRIDVFQFEYNSRWVFSRSFLNDVFELVEGLPYRLGRIHPQSIELFDGWHEELERFFQSNYVLIHERAVGWLPRSEGGFDGANTFVAR